MPQPLYFIRPYDGLIRKWDGVTWNAWAAAPVGAGSFLGGGVHALFSYKGSLWRVHSSDQNPVVYPRLDRMNADGSIAQSVTLNNAAAFGSPSSYLALALIGIVHRFGKVYLFWYAADSSNTMSAGTLRCTEFDGTTPVYYSAPEAMQFLAADASQIPSGTFSSSGSWTQAQHSTRKRSHWGYLADYDGGLIGLPRGAHFRTETSYLSKSLSCDRIARVSIQPGVSFRQDRICPLLTNQAGISAIATGQLAAVTTITAAMYNQLRDRVVCAVTWKGKIYGYNHLGQLRECSLDLRGIGTYFQFTGSVLYDIRDSSLRGANVDGQYPYWNYASAQSNINYFAPGTDQDIPPFIIGSRVMLSNAAGRTFTAVYTSWVSPLRKIHLWEDSQNGAPSPLLSNPGTSAGIANVRFGLGLDWTAGPANPPINDNADGGGGNHDHEVNAPFVDTGTHLVSLIPGRPAVGGVSGGVGWTNQTTANFQVSPSTLVKWDGTNAPTYYDLRYFGDRPEMWAATMWYDKSDGTVMIVYADRRAHQWKYIKFDIVNGVQLLAGVVATFYAVDEHNLDLNPWQLQAWLVNDRYVTADSVVADPANSKNTVSYKCYSADSSTFAVTVEYDNGSGWTAATRKGTEGDPTTARSSDPAGGPVYTFVHDLATDCPSFVGFIAYRLTPQ